MRKKGFHCEKSSHVLSLNKRITMLKTLTNFLSLYLKATAFVIRVLCVKFEMKTMKDY